MLDWKIPLILGILLIAGVNSYFYYSERVVDVPEGDVEYFWDFGDGVTSNETAPEHVFEEGGEYNVKLVITNGTEEITKKFTVDAHSGMKYKASIIPIQIEGFEVS